MVLKKSVFIVLFFLSLFEVFSQTSSFIQGFAKYSGYNRPFWADKHSTLVTGEVALALNAAEYDWAKTDKKIRPFIFANLGADLPIWAGNFMDNKYGFSVTLPFFIDVWLDMFERTTAPVINTAYRFGLPEFVFIHRLDNPENSFVKNYSIKLSLLKHECTHIGDELAIMRKNEGLPLTRVNVSSNYVESVFTLNDPENTVNSNHGFKFGIMVLHNFKDGWYSILPEEGDTSVVVPSKFPIEAFLQYQYQSRVYANNFQIIGSIEWRNRAKYGYPLYYINKNEEWTAFPIPEYRSNSLNFATGVRYCAPSSQDAYFSKIGLAIRGYIGINPYGQFRSIPLYSQLGLVLIFE